MSCPPPTLPHDQKGLHRIQQRADEKCPSKVTVGRYWIHGKHHMDDDDDGDVLGRRQQQQTQHGRDEDDDEECRISCRMLCLTHIGYSPHTQQSSSSSISAVSFDVIRQVTRPG